MTMYSGAQNKQKVGSTAAHQISNHLSRRHTSDSAILPYTSARHTSTKNTHQPRRLL